MRNTLRSAVVNAVTPSTPGSLGTTSPTPEDEFARLRAENAQLKRQLAALKGSNSDENAFVKSLFKDDDVNYGFSHIDDLNSYDGGAAASTAAAADANATTPAPDTTAAGPATAATQQPRSEDGAAASTAASSIAFSTSTAAAAAHANATTPAPDTAAAGPATAAPQQPHSKGDAAASTAASSIVCFTSLKPYVIDCRLVVSDDKMSLNIDGPMDSRVLLEHCPSSQIFVSVCSSGTVILFFFMSSMSSAAFSHITGEGLESNEDWHITAAAFLFSKEFSASELSFLPKFETMQPCVAHCIVGLPYFVPYWLNNECSSSFEEVLQY